MYDSEVVLAKKDFSVTSDLTINNSHIPISVVINGSLTQAELLRQQEVNIDKVAKMYPMVDEDSLPLRVQYAWMNWVCQVPIFGVNSRKYNLNMVKYYFVKIISNLSDIKVTKKDNSYMFLTTPWFKFLGVRNYLAPSLSYSGWCKANGYLMGKARLSL